MTILIRMDYVTCAYVLYPTSQWGSASFNGKTYCDVTLPIIRGSFFKPFSLDGLGGFDYKAPDYSISWGTIEGSPREKIRFIANRSDLEGFNWIAITNA